MKQFHGILVGLLGVVLALALVSDASRTSTKAFIALFFVLNLLAFRRQYRDDAPGTRHRRDADGPEQSRGRDDPAPR